MDLGDVQVGWNLLFLLPQKQRQSCLLVFWFIAYLCFAKKLSDEDCGEVPRLLLEVRRYFVRQGEMNVLVEKYRAWERYAWNVSW